MVHSDRPGIPRGATLHHLLLHGDFVLDLGAVGANLYSEIDTARPD